MSARIVDLGRVLNPVRGKRLLAMLRAALDASLDNPPRISAVAGYVAPLEEWVNVEAAWSDALAYWHLDCFHLSDLQDRLGVDHAALCEKMFTNIIVESGLCAFGAALFDDDWFLSDWGPMTTVRLDTRYKQCLDMSLDVLGRYTREHFPGEQVAVVCCLDDSEHYIEQAFLDKKQRFDHFVSINAGLSKDIVPLQCADLGVGMLRRSWRLIMDNDEKVEYLPWGDMPKGNKTKMTSSMWSLHFGAIHRRVGHVLKKLRDKNADNKNEE